MVWMCFFHLFPQLVCVIEYCDVESQQQAMEILHTNSPYRVVTAEQAINEGAVSSFLKDKVSLAGSSAAPPLLRPQVCTRVLVLHNIVTPQDVCGCSFACCDSIGCWAECTGVSGVSWCRFVHFP